MEIDGNKIEKNKKEEHWRSSVNGTSYFEVFEKIFVKWTTVEVEDWIFSIKAEMFCFFSSSADTGLNMDAFDRRTDLNR